MKSLKYKDQNKENYKKKIIVLFVMIFILMLASFFLGKLGKEPVIEEIAYENISSIKEVIEYHKSRYISEMESSESGFYLDVYVSFSKPLYNGDNSNEAYYTALIEDGAKILRYRSYKLIDNEHDIIVKVVCKNNEIDTIIINDIEDYFIYTDSQISLRKYEEIKTTQFSVQSEVLQRCIDSGWSKDTYLGERDSIFDGYYIYFDEGIRAKFIDGKIYNIIFTKQYTGNVIENLFPGVDKEYIEALLGKPTFQDDELDIIGYKGEQFYIFFSGEEISIYRNSSLDSDEFFALADKLINEDVDLLEFMNELTYMWPDYNEYSYNSTSVFITYPLKGIEIRINYGDINGILVYNNNKSTLSKIGRYLENTIFVARLQKDLVYEAEKIRFEKESSWIDKCKEYEATLSEDVKKRIGESLNYAIYPKIDSNGYIAAMNFISKFNREPNRELNDGIHSYLWINSDYFVFSKYGIGIYFYNLTTGRVQRIKEGTENFELVEYKDGILKYDDKEVELNFTN